MKTLVCYSGKYPHLGGISTHLDMIKSAAINNDNIHFCFSNLSEKAFSGGSKNVNIYLLFLSYFYRFFKFGVLYIRLRKKYEKFICHDYFSALFFILIGKDNVSIVVHGELANELVSINSIKYDSFFYNIFIRFENFIYKNSLAVYCVDTRIQNYVLSYKLPTLVMLIKNFVNINFLNESIVLADEEKYSLNFRYIYCSRRLVPKNGVFVLMQAYQLLKKLPIDIPKLVIAGSGDQLAFLQKYSLDNDLDVLFLGDVDYKLNIFYCSKASINVVPSVPIGEYVEAISYSMLESLAFRVPVLVSNVGGLAEVVRNDFNGFLFNYGDAVDCSNQIIKIIQLSEENRFYIVENGFITIENNHSASAVVEKIYKI